MNCKYKVNIKDIQYNYKVKMEEIQSKYKFNIFCRGYDDSDIKGKINDMYNAWPKVTGEGETITLNDTVSATMPLGLKGNTYQDSTTGKNLINIADTTGITAQTTLGTITLSAGTYTAQATLKNNANVVTSIRIYDTGSTLLKDCTTVSGNSTGISSGTFTLTQETTIRFIVRGASAGYNVDVSKCQLESGSTATSWEKYTGGTASPNPDYPQEVHTVSGDNEVEVSNGDNTQSTTYPINLPEGMELCKIGNYQDYIYKQDKKWYLEKKIGKVVLNGTETWYLSNNRETYSSFYYTNNNVMLATRCFCDKLVNPSNYGNITGATKEGIAVHGTVYRIYVSIPNTTATTAQQLETWLSSNNLTTYYVLASPTYTKIEGTLASQLEALEQAQSYSGQTNISQVNNDAPFIITASTLKDLSSLGTSTVSTLNTASVNRLGTQVLNQSINPVNLELNSEDLELNNEEETIEETPEER